ncbi:lytic transglycosylase domain-containing protein [Tissierella creatinophila]|uniref:Soluble lytic murein transglycosylase n=1 Tax=Tissierella creatinophila DSM 6911 TaxID=1123403 RepID=A0A1U7M7P9_TISCR|nr:lytic transglycosylase domain-containing protein [Tissierella creatinophila]OLS03311.1 soluble lytic murein transglycosylase precursor [Tissierella creatinophila DSM 6911]
MRFFKRIITKILIFFSLLFIISSVIGVIVYSRYPLYYKEDIGKAANKYNIDPYLIVSIINVESGFHKEAKSSKDARGLMQIVDQTGEWGAKELKIANYQKDNLFDPKLNIELGTWYLERLGKEFDGDLNLILAAYNGGSGNVNKWLKDKNYSKDGKKLDKIPFKETENYVEKVKSGYENYKKLYGEINFQDAGYDSLFINYIYKLKSYIKEIEE